MKRIMLAAIISVATSGAAIAADPAVGTWQTQPGDGASAHVEIALFGSSIGGITKRTFKGSDE